MLTYLYAVLVFLVIRFSVSLFNFLSNPRLGYYGKRFSDTITIIVSGKRANATALLDSLAQQDHEHYEVVFRDEEEKQVLENTKGTYFLFVNADLVIQKGLLNNVIQRMKTKKLDLLSLVPTRRAEGWKAKILEPLPDLLLLSLYPLRFVQMKLPLVLTVADTSFMFYEARTFRKLANEAPTTMNAEVLLANQFVLSTKPTSIDHLSLTLYRMLGRSVPAAIFYLLLVILGPLMVLLNFDLSLLLLPVGLIFLIRVMLSFLSGQNPLIQLLLHPLQMAALCYLLLKLCWNKLFRSVKAS